jgi:hypothetical protein
MEFSRDRVLVIGTLKEKCDFKGMPVPDTDSLASSPLRIELESEWENMLAHQLPQLPPLANFFSEVPSIFNWLTSVLAPAELPAIPFEPGEDHAWRPPVMVHSWRSSVPLETIRFAAANHLCVELAYGGSRRLIEPYSLRRTRDGNII